MPSAINTSGFQPSPEISGEHDEDTELLKQLAGEAEAYVQSFKWCPPIEQTYLAFGVGGIIGLFLVRFARPIGGFEDQELWVVVGDLPAAYFVTEDARTAPDALEAYCELMEDWAERVLSGGDVSDCYPVAAEPTAEHARMLLSRLEHVRQEFVPIAADAPTLKSYDVN
jgi:hypothetical protein